MMMPAHMRFVMDIRQINDGGGAGWLGKLRDRLEIASWAFYARYLFDNSCFCHVDAARRVMGAGWSRWSHVIPVGVNKQFLTHPWPERLPERAPKVVRFIYIGTLSRIRCLETLLYAAQRLSRETDAFGLVLVGHDEAQGYYHQLLYDLGLQAVVSIQPAVSYDDVPSIIASHDVALAYVPDFPAWRYQPPLKIIEYRAIGIPIVATSVGANRDLVIEGVNGILVYDSVDSLYQGMRRIVTEPDRLSSYRSNARIMRQGQTWDDIAWLYERDVYLGGALSAIPQQADRL
jgi:glycosyltransferase involved in cell wall biosynthesis